MKNYFKYLLIIIVFLSLTTAMLFSSPAENSQNTILIKGSTIMYKLNLAWAQAFMQKNPKIIIDIEGMVTSKGINELLNGRSDIAPTSGRISTQELVTAAQKGVKIAEYYCGFAMYTIAVNPANPVSKLTQAQVYDIFTGNVTNWSQVGGKDAPIHVFYRQIDPGVYDHFLEGIIKLDRTMLTEQLSKNVKVLATPPELEPAQQMIAQEIAADPDAISYLFSIYLTPNVKAVAIKGSGEHYIKPTVDNVLVEQYPYLRPLYFYVNKNSLKKVELFIDFIQSSEGAKISKSLNFVPYIPEAHSYYELIL